MCTLEELKEQNNKEHTAITESISNIKVAIESALTQIKDAVIKVESAKSFSTTVKWVAGLLLFIISLSSVMMANYARMTHKAEMEVYNTRMDTFKTMQLVLEKQTDCADKMQMMYEKEYLTQVGWTHDIYDSVIRPNEVRSIQNSKDIIWLKQGLK